MIYKRINESCIEVIDTEQFVSEHILDCGQVFRYRNNGDCHTIWAEDKICLLQKANNCVTIKSDDIDYFINYFDLNRDYGKIKESLQDFEGLEQALEYGKGIRILNQDPYEMIISFIISANNNIPRIKGIIESICTALGEHKDGYYAFPTKEALASVDERFFESIGAGYRARYLADTAKRLLTFDVEGIRNLDTASARKELTSLMGVGNKVADCILLFGYHKTDLFPVDTWSKKIYHGLSMPDTNNVNVMSKNLVDKFGSLSGYAQQYLFYYYRSNY